MKLRPGACVALLTSIPNQIRLPLFLSALLTPAMSDHTAWLASALWLPLLSREPLSQPPLPVCKPAVSSIDMTLIRMLVFTSDLTHG